MARKTQEESQKTRDSILDAAEAVFLQKGIAQASMADIACEAGISRGAVYGHYKNKIELGMAMCYRALGSPDEWPVRQSSDAPALEQLRAHCLLHLKAYAESDSRRRVLEILYTRCEHIAMHDDLLKLRERINRSYEEAGLSLLSRAVNQGELPHSLEIHRAYDFLDTVICGLCYQLMDKETSPGTFLRNLEPFLDAALDAIRHSPSLRRQPGA